MFSGKRCSINACTNVFSYLLQVELNGFPRNICFSTFPGWRVEHYSASCAFPDDQDENMSIAFYPAIHRSRDIYAVGTHSQFVYLFLAGRDKTSTVKKDFSFANLRISTLRFSTYTECGQMVKYIIRTRLYWNDSNILFSRCRSTMWIFGKKGATHFEDAIVFNIDRKVMNIFRSVCENFVIRMTDRWNQKK